MLSLLAGGPRLLCRQHIVRGRLGQEEVRPHTRGLLRMSTPQEGGESNVLSRPRKTWWLTGRRPP